MRAGLPASGFRLPQARVRALVRSATVRGSRWVRARPLRSAAVLAGLGLMAFALRPIPRAELALTEATSLVVEARDGTVLRELASRDGEGHAAPAHLEALPAHVWQAFVAEEDRRFFSHPGVDPLALGRAALVDLRGGRFSQGGSTLTQQLARLIEPRPRTLLGKLHEALLALRLTRTLSKREVLEQYLTRVPLGNGVRGVEAAARLYFDRPAARLTLLQAALLAALPKSPAALDPLRDPERARLAAERVLGHMQARGFLTGQSRTAAAGEPLDLARERFRRAFEAPHFVEHVASHLAPPGAARVRTTLDLALQRRLEEIVRDELRALEGRNATSAAVLVLDNATGEVLAYVGAPDWFDEAHLGRIDGVRIHRQPGSALKPFAYGAALQSRGLTAATLLSDTESHFATPTGDYAPHNYDRRAHGPVRLRVALGSSYNVPAVRVAELLGPGVLLSTLHAAGFASLTLPAEHYGPGLVLGDGEVLLEELARGYAGLARGGVATELTYLLPVGERSMGERSMGERSKVESSKSKVEAASLDSRRLSFDFRLSTFNHGATDAPLHGPRFLSAEATALIVDILADPAARAPAFGLDNALRFPFPVAAKTGTSRAFTDNWTAGFTAERTVAVWVGNMSGATMKHVSGITGAGPLFHRAMLLAMEGVDAPAPLFGRGGTPALEEREVCALSGQLAGPDCPARAREKFAPGTAPRSRCEMHSAQGTDLGPRFYDWAEREGVATLAGTSTSGAAGAPAHAQLSFPADGDEFLRDRDLPEAYQTIPVRALAPAGSGPLELQLDGGPRTPLASPFSTRVPAAPGGHRLRLFRGGSDTPEAVVRFLVRG